MTMAELSIILIATDMNAWADMAHKLPLCPTEDSVNCAWIAEIQGNGFGESFIALESEDVVTLIYRPGPDGEGQIVTYLYED